MPDIYDDGWVILIGVWGTEAEDGMRWRSIYKEDITALIKAATAVLYHDERGQGQLYSDAMEAMSKALKNIKGVE